MTKVVALTMYSGLKPKCLCQPLWNSTSFVICTLLQTLMMILVWFRTGGCVVRLPLPILFLNQVNSCTLSPPADLWRGRAIAIEQ